MLTFKISAPIAWVSILTIGLTVFLNVGKFERTLSEIEQSRLHFILSDLKKNLETGLDMGLPVRSLGNAQPAIDGVIRGDAEILTISVIDNDGLVVFSSGAAVGEPFPPLATVAASHWNGQDAKAMVYGVKLSNNFGETAGALVMRYSLRRHHQFIEAIARQINVAAIVAVLLTMGCLVSGIHLIGRRIFKTLSELESGLLKQALPEGADRPALALAAQVNQVCVAAMTELDAARQHLLQLPRAGP